MHTRHSLECDAAYSQCSIPSRRDIQRLRRALRQFVRCNTGGDQRVFTRKHRRILGKRATSSPIPGSTYAPYSYGITGMRSSLDDLTRAPPLKPRVPSLREYAASKLALSRSGPEHWGDIPEHLLRLTESYEVCDEACRFVTQSRPVDSASKIFRIFHMFASHGAIIQAKSALTYLVPLIECAREMEYYAFEVWRLGYLIALCYLCGSSFPDKLIRLLSDKWALFHLAKSGHALASVRLMQVIGRRIPIPVWPVRNRLEMLDLFDGDVKKFMPHRVKSILYPNSNSQAPEARNKDDSDDEYSWRYDDQQKGVVRLGAAEHR